MSTRRRLDVEERKAAILAAAARRFAAAPFAEVSMTEIAQDAGASAALVHHYFGSKGQLLQATVGAWLDALDAAEDAALADLPPGSSSRDQVRALLLATLDHVQVARPPRPETTEAMAQFAAARAASVTRLEALLRPTGGVRHAYALVGALGFLQACVDRWVADACPEDERYPLVDAALGALEGALGDWG